MKSEKSYKKFQTLYEFIFPLVGLTSLYCWEGALELKIVLTLIILRVCYSWSEMAALEKVFVHLFSRRGSTGPDGERVVIDAQEPEIYSWAEFIGLVLQMGATIVVALAVAWGLELR